MIKMQEKLVLANGAVLKNRLIMAPMTNKMSFYDGVVTSDELCYYAFRTGDVGMMVTAAAYVHASGKCWEGQLGVREDKHLLGLSKLAATMKQGGTKAILQLFHAGSRTNSRILYGELPVSASAIAQNSEVSKALTGAEIEVLIAAFATATKRAIQAGFDGVEIHGADGYLLQQFYDSATNVRTDHFGGTNAQRYQFIGAVVDRIMQTVKMQTKAPFIVGYRLSPQEQTAAAVAETNYLINRLIEQGIDYLQFSLADFQELRQFGQFEATIANRVPLFGGGGVKTIPDIQAALQLYTGVAVGQAMLIDPRWAEKIFADQEAMIRRELLLIDRPVNYISNGALDCLAERRA